jgi:hypothetical protein
MERLSLLEQHADLVKQKYSLLFSNGIKSTDDKAYLNLPEYLQSEYLDIQNDLDVLHKEMQKGFIKVK